MKLILASASPRRAQILRNAGFAFDVLPSNVDETRLTGERAEDYLLRVATAKAGTAAERAEKAVPSISIGADTVVLLGGEILGKPASLDAARLMLRKLSGETHEVLSALALVSSPHGHKATHIESTKVTFVPLCDAEIEGYLGSGEPFDKAGAYGIQGIGGRYVSRIEGCYFNVMGLPLSRLWSMLSGFGWEEASKPGSQAG